MLVRYAGVNPKDIKGMRAPFLAVGGDTMFRLLNRFGGFNSIQWLKGPLFTFSTPNFNTARLTYSIKLGTRHKRLVFLSSMAYAPRTLSLNRARTLCLVAGPPGPK